MIGSAVTLHKIDEKLWVAERTERVFGLQLPVRTTVIQAGSGDLLVYCPGPLDAVLRASVDQVGTVRYLCAPNRLQAEHIVAWSRAYPDAAALGAPGLADDQPQWGLTGLLDAEALADCRAELDVLLCEGASKVNEVVMLHRPSRSLLLSELACHVPPSSSLLSRAVLRLNLGGRRFGPPRSFRWLIDDPQALGRSIEQVSSWDFERVIVQYGAVLETGGPQALGRAFKDLGRPTAWWQ